eukprot:8389047-Alexandrium_andersonii.AAC.1
MCIRDRRMGAEPPRLWAQVLGEAAAGLWTLIHELDEAGIACCPATLFALSLIHISEPTRLALI